MRLLSFRLRIALLSALISGVVLAGFGLSGWYLLYRQKIESLDTEIRALGTRHPGWLANRANFDRFGTSLEFIFGEEHRDQLIVLVKSASGQILYVSPRWPKALDPARIDCSLADVPKSAADESNTSERAFGWGRGGLGRGLGPGGRRGPVVFTKAARFLTVTTPESTWRLGIMGNDDLQLAVGLSCEPLKSELNHLRNQFLVIVPLALLLVGAGGWLVSGRALYPLSKITQTAEQVTARGLDQRIPISEEAPEISRLVVVFNGMMDRLEASFRQATRFSADASHELKTPLAVMQAELENAIQSAAPGSSEQRVFSNLLEEIQRLKTIARRLLLLAQADAGRLKLKLEPLDLSAELEAMVEDARILGQKTSLSFHLSIQPHLTIQADRSLLDLALMNLIKNAVTHNEPGGSVGLTLAPQDGQVVLTVCNTGPGIPAAEQAKIFERFYRLGPARSPTSDGLGLGLNLAREIVLAHHGRLLLLESRPGHTCFSASVPA